jgi:GntR family transcriptional regulator
MALLNRPLYLQVHDSLLERIASGAWKPGAAIPNEGDLARQLGVSPGTMRKALDLLESEQLITRRQGKGTFVNDQGSEEAVGRFMRLRRRDGQIISGDVTPAEIRVDTANEMDSARLGIACGEAIYRIRKLRLHDRQPLMFEEASLPAALYPNLETNDGVPSIVVLAQRHGLVLGRAEERIGVTEVPSEVAKALQIAPGSSVAVLDRVVHTLDGRAAEWRLAWCTLREHYYLAEM